MAKTDDFLKRLADCTSEAEREKTILNNTPVIEDDPVKAFNAIYEVSKDPWKYDDPAYENLWTSIAQAVGPLLSNRLVVDLGCGRCNFWVWLANNSIYFPSVLCGCDIAERAIEISRRDLK